MSQIAGTAYCTAPRSSSDSPSLITGRVERVQRTYGLCGNGRRPDRIMRGAAVVQLPGGLKASTVSSSWSGGRRASRIPGAADGLDFHRGDRLVPWTTGLLF